MAVAVRRVFIGLIAMLLLTACAGKATRTDPPTVHHMVLAWLKEPGDAEGRQRIFDVSKSFAAIPGVKRVHAGTSMPSERDIVDDSFDVGMIISFADRAAMESYLVHPTHAHAVREIIKPLVRKILVYDFSE